MKDNTIEVFFTLLRAGLWAEPEEQVMLDSHVDWEKVYQLAREQSVLGLVLAGIDCLPNDQKPPKALLLQWIGEIQKLEQRNRKMNGFIGELVGKMRKAGIYTLLVKGQGVAQCYERPLWRSCGDVDLFLSDDNYCKAEKLLMPLASKIDDEITYAKHKALIIDEWTVELHGSLRSGLWRKVDCELDKIQYDIFCGGNVRSWMNDGIRVFLPRADEDVVYVFSHILQHFYKEGIGLRQICDWCRLLWRYRSELDLRLLESRIRGMGLMSEWKAFAALTIDYLGMPLEAMPFYKYSGSWSRKAENVMKFVLETGNFGHNRDYSYLSKYPYVFYKAISAWKHIVDFGHYFVIFPLDACKVTWKRMCLGVSVVIKGGKQKVPRGQVT